MLIINAHPEENLHPILRTWRDRSPLYLALLTISPTPLRRPLARTVRHPESQHRRGFPGDGAACRIYHL